jgi:hypothetical protein
MQFGFPGHWFDMLMFADAAYNRDTNVFSGSANDDYGDYIDLNADGSYHIEEDGTWDEVGLFSVNAVPEPSSVLLLLPILVCVASALKAPLCGPSGGPLKRLNRV